MERTIVPIVDLISILHDLGEFGSATPLPLMMTRLWHAGATVRRMSPGDERALSGPADLLPGAAIIQRPLTGRFGAGDARRCSIPDTRRLIQGWPEAQR